MIEGALFKILPKISVIRNISLTLELIKRVMQNSFGPAHGPGSSDGKGISLILLVLWPFLWDNFLSKMFIPNLFLLKNIFDSTSYSYQTTIKVAKYLKLFKLNNTPKTKKSYTANTYECIILSQPLCMDGFKYRKG